MTLELQQYQQRIYIPERLIVPEDLTPAERMLVGSTELERDTRLLLTADSLRAKPQYANGIREQSEIVLDEATGKYMPPRQVITVGILDEKATRELIKSGLNIHMQLPPLDRKGRVGGVWELALVNWKEGNSVVTNEQQYRRFIDQERLNGFFGSRFSVIPPKEGRPFPRLALSRPSRRA